MLTAKPQIAADRAASQSDPGRARFHVKRRIDYWVGGTLLLLLFPLVRLLALILRRDHSLEHRRGCVVIKLVGAGSLFLAMPSLQAIRAKISRWSLLPGRHAAGGALRAVVRMVRCLLDHRRYSSLYRLVTSSLRVLWNAARNTDHLIDLEVHSRLTTVFSLLTTVRNRIGFVDEIVFWRRGFYTHTTWFNTHGPAYAFYDLLAQWFGIERVEVSDFHAAFRAQVRDVTLPGGLELPARYVAIGHACSDFGKERQLRPEEWGRVLRPLALLGCQFVFLGGAVDAALADVVIATLGSGRNLCGQLTLMQSARVIAGATGFYGIDLLLLHLARALDRETTSFWGPTDPASRLRPGRVPERVNFARMPCSPCIHINETPPCQGRRDCMAQAISRVVGGSPSIDQEAISITGWSIGHHGPAATPVSVSYA